MEKLFEKLKQYYGSHKAAAIGISVSYSRYNEWRWDPDKMPDRAKAFIKLAVDAIEHSCVS